MKQVIIFVVFIVLAAAISALLLGPLKDAITALLNSGIDTIKGILP